MRIWKSGKLLRIFAVLDGLTHKNNLRHCKAPDRAKGGSAGGGKRATHSDEEKNGVTR